MEYFNLFGLPSEITDDIFRKLYLVDSIQQGHLTISKNWSSRLWKVQSELDLRATTALKLDKIQHLIHPANIKRLSMLGTNMIESDKQILSFYNLVKLEIPKLNSDAVNVITKLTALKDLLVTNDNITEIDLVSIGNSLTRLTSINILSLTNVQDWPNISNLTNLRFASFPRSSFAPTFYERLLSHSKLVHLNVGFCRITKTGMDSICKMTQLEQISLLKLPMQADPSDAWLDLSKLTNLLSLACHIPKDAAHLISKMEKLTSLNVYPEEFQAPFDMNLYSTLTSLSEIDVGMSFTKFPTTWTNLTKIHANGALIDRSMNFDTLTRLKLLSVGLESGACHNLSKLTNLVHLRILDRQNYKTYNDLHHVSKCQNLIYLRVTADNSCVDLITKLSTLTSLEILCKPNESWPAEDIYKLTALRGLRGIYLEMADKPKDIEEIILEGSNAQ